MLCIISGGGQPPALSRILRLNLSDEHVSWNTTAFFLCRVYKEKKEV